MDKERKIAFYTLVKDMWANNADGLEGLIPFYEIKAVYNLRYFFFLFWDIGICSSGTFELINKLAPNGTKETRESGEK